MASSREEYLIMTQGASRKRKEKYWPTPTAQNAKHSTLSPSEMKRVEKGTAGLHAMVFFPTPTSRDYKGMSGAGRQERRGNPSDTLPNAVGGSLNPTWVEWLMGFPEGWTDLNNLETQSSPKSLK
jgi:hypothetical protein